MIVIVGAPTQIGQMVAKKLNEENFNYLVLTGVNDTISDELVQQSVQYWHWVSYSQLNDWIKDQADEIEFIIWCDSLQATINQTLFADFWQAAYQFQIPFLALTEQEGLFYRLTKNLTTPFFWSVLIVQNLYFLSDQVESNPGENQLQTIKLPTLLSRLTSDKATPEILSITFADDVVDLVYFFIHHREVSGVYHLPFQHISSSYFDSSEANLRLPKGKLELANWPEEAQDYQHTLAKIGYIHPFQTIQDII
ncbi:MAG: hypothetical protein ACFB15_06980 [Cyclobacteriaceae bacterium]